MTVKAAIKSRHSEQENPLFETTHWSAIERARGAVSELTTEALNHLCAAYWQPIYYYARRKGLNHHEANDAAQELCQKVVQQEFLEKLNRERGRFRTYLLACLDNYLMKLRAREHAQKRGGYAEHVELGVARDQCAQDRPPDAEFDYRWTLALIAEVLRQLQAECEAAGRGKVYALLRPILVHDPDSGGVKEASATLGLSEEAVRTTLFRLRKRYKELFKQEVARTLANPFEVEDEIRHLLQLFQ